MNVFKRVTQSKLVKKAGALLAKPYAFVEGLITYLGDNDWSIYSAGLSFYALLALTPFVILGVVVGGAFFGSALAQQELHHAIASEAGPQVADLVVSFAAGAADLTSLSLASVFAFVLLIWSSTNLLTQVRNGLHRMFDIEPVETPGGIGTSILGFLRYRLFAALGTIAFGALFIGLLSTRIALTLIEEKTSSFLTLPFWMWDIADIVVALTFITLAVRVVYWLLPDRRPTGWAPWVGGLITAILLVLGRTGVAVYLSVGTVGSAYGAAAAMVVFLGWAYWSAYVFLLGARITWVLAKSHAKRAKLPFPPKSVSREKAHAVNADVPRNGTSPTPPGQTSTGLNDAAAKRVTQRGQHHE